MSSFANSMPPAETFIARLNIASYQGSYTRGEPIPIAGIRAAGLEADSFAAGLTLLWRPPVDLGRGVSVRLPPFPMSGWM